MLNEKELEKVKRLLDISEDNIRQAKSIIFASSLKEKIVSSETGSEKVIEGVFDGEEMIGSDEKNYPVPANYASKSKLVFGDMLKLTIVDDGTFLYKQIGPVPRKKLVGLLEEVSKAKYFVKTSEGIYRVLPASVTYFKAVPGDELTIIIPEGEESEWAAIENLVKHY